MIRKNRARLFLMGILSLHLILVPRAKADNVDGNPCAGYHWLFMYGEVKNYCHDAKSGILKVGPSAALPCPPPVGNDAFELPMTSPPGGGALGPSGSSGVAAETKASQAGRSEFAAVAEEAATASATNSFNPADIALTQAATAGTLADRASKGQGLLASAPGQDHTGGKSASGGPAGAGSSPDISAGSSPGTEAAKPTDSAATAMDANDPNATYSSGGAGDGEGSGGRRGGGAISGGSAKEMDFGSSAPDPAVMKSEDPEDYFTRLDLDQSLFKIVHTFLETKSRSWALEGVAKSNALKKPATMAPAKTKP